MLAYYHRKRSGHLRRKLLKKGIGNAYVYYTGSFHDAVMFIAGALQAQVVP